MPNQPFFTTFDSLGVKEKLKRISFVLDHAYKNSNAHADIIALLQSCFGYETECPDQHIENDIRGIFYELEDIGIIKISTYSESLPLYKEWRVNVWQYNGTMIDHLYKRYEKVPDPSMIESAYYNEIYRKAWEDIEENKIRNKQEGKN